MEPAQQDQQWLFKAQQGDAQAWQELVHHWTPRVFGLIVRYTRDQELAEEITQETFVKLVSALQRDVYRHQGSLGAWLMQVGMNTLRDEMRRRKRHAKPIDMQATSRDGQPAQGDAISWQNYQQSQGQHAAKPYELVSLQEEHATVIAAIEQMSDQDQQIIYMRHTAGLTFSEIADAINQPLGTVLARAHRAMKKLRQELAWMQPEAQKGESI